MTKGEIFETKLSLMSRHERMEEIQLTCSNYIHIDSQEGKLGTK